MPDDISGPNRFARDLFAPLPARYDRLAELLSFGQNGQWRAAMVGHVVPADGVILDVASGTAGVALQLAARSRARVVGVDLTEEMLRQGRRRVAAAGTGDRVVLVAGRAEQLPFPDGYFDALTFTYLLRYVQDPQATLTELARVLKPGGTMASLEFCVPDGPVWGRPGGRTPGWCCPSEAWRWAGGSGSGWAFPGPEHLARYRRYPIRTTVEAWQKAGLVDVGTRIMSLGGGLVMWGTRQARGGGRSPRERGGLGGVPPEVPAHYAARPGRWRDWWTLLHPPYTAWHLSYCVIGAALAPQVQQPAGRHRTGVLPGRGAGRACPRRAARTAAANQIPGARWSQRWPRAWPARLALGVAGVYRVGWTLIPFMVAGPVLVIAYNAELFGGAMHTDFGFAAAWGAFPVLTAT